MNVPADSSARPSYGVLLPAGRRLVLGEPKVVRDKEARELRITAPLQEFGPLDTSSAGAAVTTLMAWGEVAATAGAGPVQSSTALLVLDVAAKGNRFSRIGDRSCVRVGG